MSQPWYNPFELVVALGVTLPLFLFYGYRIYNLILDHRAALKGFANENIILSLIRDRSFGPKGSELEQQLALAEIFGDLDREVGSRRRALRADSHAVIMIGFMGTLVGVSGAFASLLNLTPGGDTGTVAMVESLVRGGLATALVSSLVAALLGGVVMAFLSHTERRVVEIRQQMLEVCRRTLSPAAMEDIRDDALSI